MGLGINCGSGNCVSVFSNVAVSESEIFRPAGLFILDSINFILHMMCIYLNHYNAFMWWILQFCSFIIFITTFQMLLCNI